MTNLPLPAQAAARQRQLVRASDEVARHFGLALTAHDIDRLLADRRIALHDTGRYEFAEGVLHKLVFAFCDSPFIHPTAWADTLAELQDAFYYYKNEAGDRYDDDELLALMKQHFDGDCQGSVEYLAGTTLDELARLARGGEGSGQAETDGSEL